MQAYGLTACMASFETRAKPHLRRQIRTLLAGKLERDLAIDEKQQQVDGVTGPRHPSEQPARATAPLSAQFARLAWRMGGRPSQ